MPDATNLFISVIQSNIVWESKLENLANFEQWLSQISGHKEIVLLPEMFSTGFSMNAEKLAEPMDGPTVSWMRIMAAKHKIILCGSLIIEEDGRYFNRLIWMQPDGVFSKYDKRHLFGYAGEDAHFTGGDTRLIVQVKGWKICPMICYDLRFPVWSRNALLQGESAYDVLLYVANWPAKRSLAWKALLQARAIENQCYCIGVNRVGQDDAGFEYDGGSRLIAPLGEVLWQQEKTEVVETFSLERAALQATRSHLPFLKDGDRFLIVCAE